MDKVWLESYDPDVPSTIDFTQYKNINDLLDEYYTAFSNFPLTSSFNSELTYKQVQNYSANLAGFFQNKLKLKKGDRLALLLPNSHQCVISFFAALRIGLIIVHIPTTYTSEEIRDVLLKTGCETIIVLNRFYEKLSPALKKTNIKTIIDTRISDLFPFFKRVVFNLVIKYIKKIQYNPIPNAITFSSIMKDNHDKTLSLVDISPNDSAFISLTSARDQLEAKYIELSHKNIISSALQCQSWTHTILSNDKTKVACFPVPLYRVGVLVGHLVMMKYGFMFPQVPDPTVIDFITSIKKPISFFGGIQFFYDLYLKSSHFQNMDFSKVVLSMGFGGISMLTSANWKILTKTMILPCYNITEGTFVVSAMPVMTDDYNNTCGIPLPSTEAKICDLNGVEQPFNHRGEIWLRGPQIMKGYWNDPEATKNAITPDGWLKTGDIGIMNAKGYISIIERVRDLIQSGSNTFSSKDIENIINTIEGVKESAVVSVKLSEGKTVIKAYVVKESPVLTIEEISSICQDHLPNYQVPNEFEFLESLPRAPIGYVVKRALRDAILEKYQSSNKN